MKSGLGLLANEIWLFMSADPKKESREVNKSPVTHISMSRGSHTHIHTSTLTHTHMRKQSRNVWRNRNVVFGGYVKAAREGKWKREMERKTKKENWMKTGRIWKNRETTEIKWKQTDWEWKSRGITIDIRWENVQDKVIEKMRAVPQTILYVWRVEALLFLQTLSSNNCEN